jgi:hypothetical protein
MNATSSVRHRSRWLRFSLRTLLVVPNLIELDADW